MHLLGHPKGLNLQMGWCLELATCVRGTSGTHATGRGPPGPRGATRAAVLERAPRGCPGARVSGPETPGNSRRLARPWSRCVRTGALGGGWLTNRGEAFKHMLRCRLGSISSPSTSPGDRDDSQTTTSAGCLRQLPGPLRAADAGRGHRPTPTDGARAAQRCKLLVLGLPKRCRSHTMLVRKALACAVTRFLSLLLPVTTPCDLNAKGEPPANPSAL